MQKGLSDQRKMVEKNKPTERVIVVGVSLKSDSFSDMKESLVELEDLSFAAGGEVVANITQVLPQFQAATLIGKGKIQELKELCSEQEATLVIIDHKLSGIQSRNLEKELGLKVLDRPQLILDIFAQRAQSYEGKLQVELAQLLDQLPRMVGAWQGSLSRQGGGIGTRGPGETALEIDRRTIGRRLKIIKKKLENVSKHRAQHRNKRKKHQVPSFSLIGYTNSGKSSLLNRLTGSQLLAKDQLFATLDPATRKLHLEGHGPVVITDTVGFIRNLPTHLIEAFKATLEESAEADVLIHVVDLSNPQLNKQIEIVDKLIEQFKWHDKPCLYVFNKLDQANLENQFSVNQKNRVFTSAVTGEGFEKLKELMSTTLLSLNSEVILYFPHEMEHKIYELARVTTIHKQEKGSRGTICHARLSQAQLPQWSEYFIDDKF